MVDGQGRTRAARAAAERALVRVVHHYDGQPEFVVLGGLVPALICATSEFQHAGTTDVDVQVNLEIAAGAVNTRRLELALRNAEFEPDGERVWRWAADGEASGVVIKFELLADLDSEPANATVEFDDCDNLGAANLRGTRYASVDSDVHELSAKIGGVWHRAQVNIAGLAGFLLAKTAAAHSRRKLKDWYDIAFVLLHNDLGGPLPAVRRVQERFADDLSSISTALRDLQANFADERAQGTQAYAEQMLVDHPDLDRGQLRADAILAVDQFCSTLLT